MRRAAAAAVLALAIAGCSSSGGGGGVPRGNPDLRHGPAAVDAYASVELLRALVIASSDQYYPGGSAPDARTQLQRARASYGALAPKVRTADLAADREATAPSDLLAPDLRRAIPPAHHPPLATPPPAHPPDA